MKYVIGQCPVLGEYDFCLRNGKNCKDADCLLHQIVSDCLHFKDSTALKDILFTTMDVCEVEECLDL